MSYTAVVALYLIGLVAAQCPDWLYEGENGPEQWGTLCAQFQMCTFGTKQSPIDLPLIPTGASDLLPLNFSSYADSSNEVSNTGKTVEVEFSPIFDERTSRLQFLGLEYRLAQFHFHTPSEHTVGGQRFPMEVHLVHRTEEGGVLAVSLLVTPGASNAALSSLLEQLPLNKTMEASEFDPPISASSFLPSDLSFRQYEGSITTPPCTQGVNWFVMTTPIELSQDQIDLVHSIVGTNNRPIQPSNGREVYSPVTAEQSHASSMHPIVVFLALALSVLATLH